MGGRTERDLYDLKAVMRLSYDCPWLTIVPTVSEDPYASQIEQGSAVDVALRYGNWLDHEIFVCGSEEMVSGSVNALIQRGARPDRIRYESFQRPVTSTNIPGAS
jgi:NAD(P)H-flavin reductase